MAEVVIQIHSAEGVIVGCGKSGVDPRTITSVSLAIDDTTICNIPVYTHDDTGPHTWCERQPPDPQRDELHCAVIPVVDTTRPGTVG